MHAGGIGNNASMQKLERVLGHLEGRERWTLPLNSGIETYVDATYVLNGDSKSQTGVVIYVGGMAVFL